MTGSAEVFPEMYAPVTSHLRTSNPAVWLYVLAGYLAVETEGPRVPVTLELDVQVTSRPPVPASSTARAG